MILVTVYTQLLYILFGLVRWNVTDTTALVVQPSAEISCEYH